MRLKSLTDKAGEKLAVEIAKIAKRAVEQEFWNAFMGSGFDDLIQSLPSWSDAKGWTDDIEDDCPFFVRDAKGKVRLVALSDGKFYDVYEALATGQKQACNVKPVLYARVSSPDEYYIAKHQPVIYGD